MKKVFLFASMLSVALFSCTSDDEAVVSGILTPEVNAPVAVKNMSADFGPGSMVVSASGSRSALSRVIGDYATPSGFAAKAGAVVNPYSAVAAPSVPEGAIELNPINPYGWPSGSFLESGKDYVISSGDYDFNIQKKFAAGDTDGTINVYIAPGVTLNGNPNIEYGAARVKYYICEGATWNCTTNPLEIHNWGTLNLTNGLYQCAPGSDGMVIGYDSSWAPIKSDATQGLFNYGTLNCNGIVQIEGVMYSSTDVKALLKGAGDVYVDGKLNAESGFGLAGKLYVADEMSGDININIGLAAHVGSINTTGMVNVTAAAQLMVEGDVVAPSMKLDGNNNGAVETVVKGKADIAGNVDVASGTKGYIEILECENYTANASDIWVGCKSDVRKKFEMNGSANFTLANGVYLHAGEAVFAADTKMEMMSKAFFKVDGKLQLNNANTNELNGSGSELAIVKAATMGANYENFENTFTGNIGVEFGAWDYNSSTGLIDNNVNLKTLSGAADVTKIEKSDCNPGFTGSKVKTDPTDPTDPEDPEDPTEPETPFEGCDLKIDIPMDVKGSWIIQADDFAIHNGDRLYESIANTEKQHEAVKEYVVVSANENVTVTVNDLCAMYEEYKQKTAEGTPYISEDGVLTIETYLWPGRKVEESDGFNTYYTIRPIPASEFGVTADGVDGKYIIGDYKQVGTDPATGDPIMAGEYANYGNDKYNVKVQAYMSYNGGGNGAEMTSYVKVSFHISPKKH